MKLNSSESNIWITSDTHYGHKNIVKGVSDWENKTGCRDFDSIEKMNSSIVDGINNNVKEDDILIHLGDWSFGGYANIKQFYERLISHKIVLILGNHDGNIVKNKFETEHLFTSIAKYMELIIDSHNIILSHYPLTSWNHAYRGSWMLHGHCHNTLFKNEPKNHWYKTSKIMDVGMDSAYELFGEYRPFNFLEIKKIMNKRSFITIDHHDKDTNG